VKEGENLLQGICVDIAATTVLEKGKTYFLFSNCKDHYYVSRFPKAGSHFGCFRKSLFQIQEEEWPPEPPAKSIPVLDNSKIYSAKLIWTTRAYKTELGTYYLRPIKTYAYVFRDRQLEKCIGCFPLHWFAEFQEVNADEGETNEAILETKALERETEEEKNEIFEQMNIFDFIE
jgi:hypothetical protein